MQGVENLVKIATKTVDIAFLPQRASRNAAVAAAALLPGSRKDHHPFRHHLNGLLLRLLLVLRLRV